MAFFKWHCSRRCQIPMNCRVSCNKGLCKSMWYKCVLNLHSPITPISCEPKLSFVSTKNVTLIHVLLLQAAISRTNSICCATPCTMPVKEVAFFHACVNCQHVLHIPCGYMLLESFGGWDSDASVCPACWAQVKPPITALQPQSSISGEANGEAPDSNETADARVAAVSAPNSTPPKMSAQNKKPSSVLLKLTSHKKQKSDSAKV